MLCRLHDDGCFHTIDIDVEQHGRSGRVVIPDVVVDELVMPDTFTGFDVQRDQAGTVKIVAGAKAAVIIDRNAVRRDVDDATFLIGRHWRPGGDVAGVLPGIVFPGVVAKFAGPRNDMKLPQEFAGPGVVTKNVTRHVFDA